MSEEITEALRAHLHATMEITPPETRRKCHWVMDREWWIDCVRLDHGDDPPLFSPDFRRLLGLGYEIRPGGSIPHLEMACPSM